MSAYNVLFEEVMEYNFNKIEEEFFTEGVVNPLGKFKKIIKNIRDNKPSQYSDDKEVIEFVDKNYDDIIKASDILEKEPDKLRKTDVGFLIRITIEFIGFMGLTSVSIPGALMFGIIMTLDTLLTPVLVYFRTNADSDVHDKLIQIKKSLSNVNTKKLPKSAKVKIDKMIDKIDDADISMSRRTRMTKESTDDKLDEIKLLVYESCYQGDITIEEKDILLSFVSESGKSISEIEKIYSCELDDDIKEVLNRKYESKKFKTLRRVSINEIKDSEKDLGIDFISNKIIPIFDVGDNDFIIYEISSKSFALFNITDSTTFKKRKNIKDIL